MELVAKVYKMTQSFPAEEKYGITSQMRRSAISIPSNIAEGAAKKGNKEFIQFLYMSLGSLAELETQIEIALRLGYCDDCNFNVNIEDIKPARDSRMTRNR